MITALWTQQLLRYLLLRYVTLGTLVLSLLLADCELKWLMASVLFARRTKASACVTDFRMQFEYIKQTMALGPTSLQIILLQWTYCSVIYYNHLPQQNQNIKSRMELTSTNCPKTHFLTQFYWRSHNTKGLLQPKRWPEFYNVMVPLTYVVYD